MVTHRVTNGRQNEFKCICVWEWERGKREWKLYNSFALNRLDHSDDSLKINNYPSRSLLRFQALSGLQRCWLMVRSDVDVVADSWAAAGTNGKRMCVSLWYESFSVFVCVKETIIMTNAHIHSSATKHSLNNFHQPDEIWKPKPMKSLCSKCSSWPVFLMHYNLQSTRGRRWAAARHDQQHEVVEQKKVVG